MYCKLDIIHLLVTWFDSSTWYVRMLDMIHLLYTWYNTFTVHLIWYIYCTLDMIHILYTWYDTYTVHVISYIYCTLDLIHLPDMIQILYTWYNTFTLHLLLCLINTPDKFIYFMIYQLTDLNWKLKRFVDIALPFLFFHRFYFKIILLSFKLPDNFSLSLCGAGLFPILSKLPFRL